MQRVRAEVDAAAAAMRWHRYLRRETLCLDTALEPQAIRGVDGDIYLAKDNRWIYLHRGFAHHRARIAALLDEADGRSEPRTSWPEVARSVGVEARFHDLRHAFATFALKAGMSLKVVSEILGHSSTAITADIYSAVLPGLKEDAVSAVEAVLSHTMVRNRLEKTD